jgi:surface protein
MFCNCNSLSNFDLSNFITNNVQDMNGMFYNCCSLIYLDLTKFTCEKLEQFKEIFDAFPSDCDIMCEDKKFMEIIKTRKNH